MENYNMRKELERYENYHQQQQNTTIDHSNLANSVIIPGRSQVSYQLQTETQLNQSQN